LLDLSNVEHVTIIGQGNVALDVARLLLKSVDELAKTDLPKYALEELGRSRVKRVEVVGRRGPLELACTTKELREMMALEDVSFETDQGLLRGAQEMVEMDPGMNQARMRKRALGLLESGSKDRKEGATKSWSLEFLQSPIRIVPTTVDGTQVGSIEFELNQLVASEGGAARAVGTGRKVVRKTDMVMKSVGYRSVGLAGLPFDERKGIMRNIDGRVVSEDGETVRSLLLDRSG
jgi:adrenodoxin-NADP+ reductase